MLVGLDRRSPSAGHTTPRRLVRRISQGLTVTLFQIRRASKAATGVQTTVTCVRESVDQKDVLANRLESRDAWVTVPPVDVNGQPLPDLSDPELTYDARFSDGDRRHVVDLVQKQQPGRDILGYRLLVKG